jgi:hypothetical protein
VTPDLIDDESDPIDWRAWLGAAAAIGIAYWVCLRLLYPGYFAPLSAFHVDFYEYASLRDKSLEQILHYPRPAAYLAMKVMGLGGLYSVMIAEIAVSLASIWLTIVLLSQFVRGEVFALPLGALLYCFLLFAHPDFYFEHRHDLPAEVSYFFAITSLVCWNAFLFWRRKVFAILLLLLSLALAVLFVFAKETYFGSMLCLVFGLVLLDRRNRIWHVGFLTIIATLEAASFQWTVHLNGPFVNTHADATNTYRMVFAPESIANVYWFYLSHAVNPYVILLCALLVYILWRHRLALGSSAVFLLAGLAAFGPHALLPNHIFEEYVWVAAPLLFAPVLLIRDLSTSRIAALLAIVSLTVFGPWAYRSNYHSPELNYELAQDKIGLNVAHSIEPLHQIKPGSRVLVTGLDATYTPFFYESYVLTEFGERTSWTLLIGPGTPPRKRNRVVESSPVRDVNIDTYDYLVRYNSEGSLVDISLVSTIPVADRNKPAIFAPDLAVLAKSVNDHPREAHRKFLAANASLNWGLWGEAKFYLDGAAENGGAKEPAYAQLMQRLEKGQREAVVPRAVLNSTIFAQPARIVDTAGSGVGATELVWTIQPERRCEIHIDAPDGKLFATATASGSGKTGPWVKNGMKFFLQDVDGGKPLTPANTLAVVTVEVAKP